ncbi:hypothetical protein CXQ85_005122 [Candidozyma haemuli]|uniref:Zn(2)-C6 fungal-type domain-containing protein n=1 Tax=Candidozyma haemuli TaxID=45357 RepID=A0A2V1B090_9ASCO|nr:hypothetical protein CXQ85_005122 [[Candida] haemuloni]PVH22551.1 hypothetical protein CXQ85_005122 [[Candida] haemuloni]
MSSESRKVIVKRRYSRAGCIECKRRKIKCDEVHPTCGNCQRVKFPCVYPTPNHGNKPRRARDIKKDPLPTVPSEQEPLHHNHTNQPPDLNLLHPHELDPNVSLHANTGGMPTPAPSLSANSALSHTNDGRNGYKGLSVSQGGHPSNPYSGGLSPLPQINTTNNNLNTTHLVESPLPPMIRLPDVVQDDAQLDMLLFENVLDDANTLVHGLASFDVLGGDSLSQFSAQSTPDGSHLKPFHSDIILNESSNENHFFNEAELQDYLRYGTDVDRDPDGRKFWGSINGQMREPLFHEQNKDPTNEELVERVNETYKLSSDELEYFRAVSCKELFLFIYPFAPTTKDNEIMHVLLEYSLMFKYLVYALIALGASCLFTITKNPKHDRNQKRSTAICMKLLVQAFTDLKNNEDSLRHIEGLILTVLILTTLFIDDPHLEGHDGFVHQHILRKLGVLIPASTTHSGFNLFSTLTSECSSCLFKLLDVIAGMNESGSKQASPEEVCEVLASLQRVSRQQIIPNLTPEDQFLIPRDHPAHPDFDDLSRKIFLPSSAYAKDTDDPSHIKYYSYCDVTQRSHFLVLNLRVFTSPGLLHLPRKHPMIKRLVEQTLKLMFFLKLKSDPCYDQNLVVAESENYWLSKSLFDFRAIMIQLPFRATVDLTDNEDDFEKLDLFFRGLVKFGGGSGIEAVARARKNREAARMRKENEKTNGSKDDMEYSTVLFPIY